MLALPMAVAALLALVVGGLGAGGVATADEDKPTPEQRAGLEKELKEKIREVDRYSQSARYADAVRSQERVVAICERLYPKQDHLELANSLNNMGGLLSALGQSRQAMAYQERALAMYERLYPKQDHLDLATCLNNMGKLLEELGERRQALPYIERALAMYERLYPKQDHSYLAGTLNHMGLVLELLGEPRKALPYFERALAMQERLHPKQDHPHLAMILNNMYAPLVELGEPEKALQCQQRALEIYERLYPKQDDPYLAQMLNNMSALLLLLGEPRKALPYRERGLAMYERLYAKRDHPALARSLTHMGTLLYALGEPRKALPYCERGLAMYNRYIVGPAASVSETRALSLAAALPGRRNFFLSVTRAIEGSDVRAYSQVWDTKATVTRIMERRHLAARAAKDQKTQALWLELADTRRQLARVLLQPAGDVEARDKEVNRLTARKEKLERDLAEQFPELRRQQEGDRLGPEELSKHLPGGTAFLDFVRYVAVDFDPEKPGEKGARKTPSYSAFVLLKGRAVRRVELGPAQPIDDSVSAWRRAIADWRADLAPAARKDLVARADRHAAELRRLIWDRIAERLPADTATLYLSPDGDLARLPWAALPTGKGDKVLLDDYRLALVPHGPFLLAHLMNEGRSPGTGDTLVAYGGVEYEQAPETLAKGDTRGSRLESDKRVAWPQLPGTERERLAVTALAEKALKDRAVTRTGRAAGTAQLLADLPKARYAHLATHGFFAEEQLTEERRRQAAQLKDWEYQQGQVTQGAGAGVRSPLAYTGLVLAGANVPDKAGPDGGVASGEALVELPLEGLRLCVLSACETGLGEYTEGEGTQALVRAIHLAGCPDVVASLWQVNDQATAALMAKFYHELWINKQPPIEALRQAQLLVSRRPDLVGDLAGERGVARQDKAVQVNTAEAPPKEAAGERLPPKLWAAFVLSGPGR